ncbi:MAG: RNA polymerase sigma factor [Planctomycetes bacterium]|nr:RNA polymerase sigma factor [Planctomycetota bacterium]
MPSGASLEETLQRAAAGDEIAWREIVETWSPRVFGLIRAQCGNVDLAEEITQSTFCTVVERIGRYSEVGRFESWLFRIAMNRLRDEMRRRRRHANPVETETLIGLAGAADGPPEPSPPGGEERSALEAALARLSESDRQVVHLRHISGLSFARIAEILGEPLGTVLARQHRALKKLRQHLADEQ